MPWHALPAGKLSRCPVNRKEGSLVWVFPNGRWSLPRQGMVNLDGGSYNGGEAAFILFLWRRHWEKERTSSIMPNRFLSLYFKSLCVDWMVIKRAELKGQPFVLSLPERGRMLVHASSAEAAALGVFRGMVVAD